MLFTPIRLRSCDASLLVCEVGNIFEISASHAESMAHAGVEISEAPTASRPRVFPKTCMMKLKSEIVCSCSTTIDEQGNTNRVTVVLYHLGWGYECEVSNFNPQRLEKCHQ